MSCEPTLSARSRAVTRDVWPPGLGYCTETRLLPRHINTICAAASSVQQLSTSGIMRITCHDRGTGMRCHGNARAASVSATVGSGVSSPEVPTRGTKSPECFQNLFLCIIYTVGLVDLLPIVRFICILVGRYR